ncbi:hypothetical protein WMY93_029183 [Mugilogobius chulae]|uniref:Uncharacterized protein n=1 Tax=Mugilogobius chulae TaxID=88201 RepID=A0AAW0MZF9_9GOBI
MEECWCISPLLEQTFSWMCLQLPGLSITESPISPGSVQTRVERKTLEITQQPSRGAEDGQRPQPRVSCRLLSITPQSGLKLEDWRWECNGSSSSLFSDERLNNTYLRTTCEEDPFGAGRQCQQLNHEPQPGLMWVLLVRAGAEIVSTQSDSL